MAKDKPAKNTKGRAQPNRKASAKKSDASPPEVAKLSVGPAAAAVAKKKTTSSTPAEFSDVSIGHAAGEVWGLLSQGTPKTVAEIKKAVEAPAEVVVAAIGWLAREYKLEFVSNGKTVKIALR